MPADAPPPRDLTDRQRLLQALEKGEAFTIPELSRIAGISQKDVAHLLDRMRDGHVELVIIPPYCMACGYRFPDRTRSKKPGRCPKCRSGRIARPRFARKVVD